MKFEHAETADVLREVGSAPSGLTQDEAAARLAKNGPEPLAGSAQALAFVALFVAV